MNQKKNRRTSKDRLFRTVANVVKAVAIIFLFIAFYWIGSSTWLVISGEKMTGRLIQFVSVESTSRQSGFTNKTISGVPVYEYEYQGHSYTIKGNADAAEELQLNDSIEILVNPSIPGHAEANTFIDLWRLPISLLFFGGILLSLIVGVFRMNSW